MFSISRSTKLFLGIAVLAATLSATKIAQATVADKSATSAWGTASVLYIGKKPAPMPEAQPMPQQGMAMHSKMMMMDGWCHTKKGKKRKMHPAEMQAMEANKPLFDRKMRLHQEIKALWSAPVFDQAAFLAKRAEIRSLKNQISQNNDAAIVAIAAETPAAERAKITECWFANAIADKPCPMMMQGKPCKGKMKKMRHHKRKMGGRK